MVEHLEKSSPLIIEEVHRWRDLIWDDYQDYKHQQKRKTDVVIPEDIPSHLIKSGRAMQYEPDVER